MPLGCQKLPPRFLLGALATRLGVTGQSEQALADPVDARTDIYGLGIVMFRVLTGRLPFDPPDDPTLVAEHLFRPPPAPSALCPGLDPRLDTIVLGALRKRPENRAEGMDRLADDLERVLGLRAGEVTPAPLRKAPDEYEAVRPTGRAAAEVLRRLVK